jgi:xyloglucan-specific endo-beta-1,4-glucanase
MGTNPRGHTTLSWMPDSNMQDFNVDISPLLTALVQNSLIPPNVYVGRVDFGSEAFHSPSNVTFSAADYSMDLACGSGSCKESSGSPRLAPGLTGLLLLGVAVLCLQ